MRLCGRRRRASAPHKSQELLLRKQLALPPPPLAGYPFCTWLCTQVLSFRAPRRLVCRPLTPFSLELLLRKLLALPSRPAVVFLNSFRWRAEFTLPGPARRDARGM